VGDHDQLLTGAFADFHAEVVPYVRPAGTTAARETVRRRRRMRIVATSALVALAIAVPVVAYAATSGDPHGPPPVIGGSPSATPSAEPTPTPTPATTTTPPAPPAAPDGRISKADLYKAKLTIPAWPKGAAEICPTGTVKFTGGKSGELLTLHGNPTYVDVDQDGARETVVLLVCSPQGADYQVLALDRDKAGKIVTLGKVVGSAGSTGDEGSDIMTIWAVEAGDGGQVRVDMGEYRPCCRSAQASQHQWRIYGWNGHRFIQTGGPTKFGPNPKVTNLVVAPGRLTMTKQSDGSWAGTLRVTIRNATAFTTPGKVEFWLRVDPGWQAQAGQQCRFERNAWPLYCTLPGLAAGADRVLTIAVKAPAGALKTDVTVNAGAVNDQEDGYPDRAPSVSVQVVQA
jgi:hypothetical protein